MNLIACKKSIEPSAEQYHGVNVVGTIFKGSRLLGHTVVNAVNAAKAGGDHPG